MTKHNLISGKLLIAKGLLALLVVFVVFALSPIKVWAQDPAQSQYDAGLDLLIERNFPEAIEAFRALVAEYPDSELADDAQFHIGVCYTLLGQHDLAVMEYYRVALDYPQSDLAPEALVKAAEALTTLDFYQDAIAMFSKVLEDYPDAEPAAYAQTCIGWLHGGMGDTGRAKAELEKVATNYPDSPCVELAKAGLEQLGASPTPAPGLVAYWKFDEGNGNTVHDSSGHGNYGTVHGASWTGGKFGNALSFDGKNDWVDIPDLTFAGDFTIEAWVKLTGSIGNADAIVGQEGKGQDINFHGARLRLYAPGDVVFAKTGTVADVWTHYAITRSGNRLTLYYNGVQDATGTWAGDFIPKAIGRGNAGYLGGTIDEVRIYNRALSQEEIRADMEAIKPVVRPVGNLLTNGDFSQGLEGWIIEEHGYYGPDILHPYSFGTHLPTTSKGYLDLGVYGGYYWASQEVEVPSADLLFSFKMKVESWSTYYNLPSDQWPPNAIGTDEAGKVSVSLVLYDAENNSIGSIEYYYSPKYTYKSTETKYCEKLGSGSPPPTGWKTVQVNLGEVIRDHLKIDASKVVKVRVGAGVTGTHEDRTYAVGYFDDFSLTLREGELPSASFKLPFLVAYWKFDEASGNTAHDSSGHGNHGTVHGASWTGGKFGNALSFDGKNDWVDIPDLTFAGDFTIEAWVKLTGSIRNADAIVGQEGKGQDINFHGARLRLYAPGDVVFAKTGTVADVWTHYAITRSGNRLTLYYNSIQDAIGTWAGDFIPKAIGRGNAGYLGGTIDEVRIYNRALSQSEIQADMKVTKPTPVPPVGNFSGVWNTNWGEMRLTQSGASVSGNYTHDKGKITGTVKGNVLIGKWSEAPSYSEPNDAGDVELELSEDGNSFSGRWRYGSYGGWYENGWTGTKVGKR